jgi:hypothetical protein
MPAADKGSGVCPAELKMQQDLIEHHVKEEESTGFRWLATSRSPA